MATVRNAQRRERRGTAAEWAAVNPILKAGELGILQDGDGRVQEIRVGDGTSAWADLGDTALQPKSVLTATYLPVSTFDANTILKADADNTPAALSVAEQRLVGRITGGSIAALTAAQIRTLLGVLQSIDEDDMSSDSATHVPTQQSVKAYVDSTAAPMFVVVDAGSNLSTARPAGAAAVYWRFDTGTEPGDSGENITNAEAGDIWFVADA